MKNAIFMGMLTLAMFLQSAPYKRPTLKQYTPEERAAMAERNGGFVKPVSNGKSVLLIDARKDSSDSLADDFVKRLRVTLPLPFTIRKESVPAGPFLKACRAMKGEEHPAVILLVEADGNAAGLEAYPEEAISIVNATRYKAPDTNTTRERLRKELWRALGLAVGGYGIMQPGCILSPVFSVEELDTVKGSVLSPMRYTGIYKAMDSLDLVKDREVLYSSAVRQGWAPPPTNDIQRALWKKAETRAGKAMPPQNP